MAALTEVKAKRKRRTDTVELTTPALAKREVVIKLCGPLLEPAPSDVDRFPLRSVRDQDILSPDLLCWCGQRASRLFDAVDSSLCHGDSQTALSCYNRGISYDA